MPKQLHVYGVSPIDFWTGWMTKEEYLAAVDKEPYGESRDTASKRLDSLVSRAGVIATRMGWEGDMRNGPFFTTIPTNGDESETVVAWKQDNNGTTFIGTPYPMPWLEG